MSIYWKVIHEKGKNIISGHLDMQSHVEELSLLAILEILVVCRMLTIKGSSDFQEIRYQKNRFIPEFHDNQRGSKTILSFTLEWICTCLMNEKCALISKDLRECARNQLS